MATYCTRIPGMASPIEATQWKKNGDHPLDYAADSEGMEDGVQRTFTGAERKAREWEGGVVRYFRHPGFDGDAACECGETWHNHGWLDVGGPGVTVCPGAYVITLPFDSGRSDRPAYTAMVAAEFEATYQLSRP